MIQEQRAEVLQQNIEKEVKESFHRLYGNKGIWSNKRRFAELNEDGGMATIENDAPEVLNTLWYNAYYVMIQEQRAEVLQQNIEKEIKESFHRLYGNKRNWSNKRRFAELNEDGGVATIENDAPEVLNTPIDSFA